jgi:hypothetical protein
LEQTLKQMMDRMRLVEAAVKNARRENEIANYAVHHMQLLHECLRWEMPGCVDCAFAQTKPNGARIARFQRELSRVKTGVGGEET